MVEMVQGHSKMPKPKRHINAMKERDRKNFHFEFTTLRFKPLSEFGTWNGKSNYTQLVSEQQEWDSPLLNRILQIGLHNNG